jgi:hypothetical protein
MVIPALSSWDDIAAGVDLIAENIELVHGSFCCGFDCPLLL